MSKKAFILLVIYNLTFKIIFGHWVIKLEEPMIWMKNWDMDAMGTIWACSHI